MTALPYLALLPALTRSSGMFIQELVDLPKVPMASRPSRTAFPGLRTPAGGSAPPQELPRAHSRSISRGTEVNPIPSTSGSPGFGPVAGHGLQVAIDTRPTGDSTVTSVDCFEEVLHELMMRSDGKTASVETNQPKSDKVPIAGRTTASTQQGALHPPDGQDDGASAQSSTPWASPPLSSVNNCLTLEDISAVKAGAVCVLSRRAGLQSHMHACRHK